MSGGTISTDGTLTSISTSQTLNCDVRHLGDSSPEFYGGTSCGTFVAVDNKVVGWLGENWVNQSQTSSGQGTSVNPYRIVTVVTGAGLRLTQTDTYVTGDESYATRVSIDNISDVSKSVVLYRAADCYLQNSDFGYGRLDLNSGAVACTAGNAADSRILQWAPLTAGSTAYQAHYSSVWSWIRSMQPFPNTCACDTHQDNGAGLSWEKTIPAGSSASFAHLTAFSPDGSTQVDDTDGDSFPDTWEEPDGGVDTDGDGSLDLKLSDYGATPNKPDIFVQAAGTTSRTCTLLVFNCQTAQTRRPNPYALLDVQRAFAQHGIRVHIDGGTSTVMNPDTGELWGARSAGTRTYAVPEPISANFSSTFDDARRNLMPAKWARIFHFALYVGHISGGQSSGVARIPSTGGAGRDLMVAWGAFPNGRGPTRREESGTLMHELGHTLGLTHGGSVNDATVNYKPNYPSVMNYSWQFSGVVRTDSENPLTYSNGLLDPLDESSLSEQDGLEPNNVAVGLKTKWYCPNSTQANAPTMSPRPSVSDTDWNCNGTVQSGLVGADINAGGARSTLRDFDDWDSLVFDGGGSLGGAGDPVSVPDESSVEETAEVPELLAVSGDPHAIQIDSPALLTIEQGTVAPVEITLTSDQPEERTYSITSTSSEVDLTQVPSEVTLSAGESKTFTAHLTSDQVTDTGTFSINATSNDPLDARQSSTEVHVVASQVPDQPLVGQIPTYDLTVEKTGTGSGSVTSSPAGIDCGATCSHVYDDGTQVILTANPTAGSTFTGWSGAGCSGTGTCEVTVNSDHTATANFTADNVMPRRAIISKVNVRGPFIAKKGKRVAYMVDVTNSGNFRADGVRVRVKGAGIKAERSVTSLFARATGTFRFKLRFKKPGKVNLTFKVTSLNAGGKSVKRTVTVWK